MRKLKDLALRNLILLPVEMAASLSLGPPERITTFNILLLVGAFFTINSVFLILEG